VPVSNNNPKRGLGRGFDSLIPTDLLDESFDPTAQQDQKVSDLRYIQLKKIVTDPDQPRKKFDEVELEDLAASIKEHGVIQPIIVTPTKNGYQIVAGERRFRASAIAGLDKVPALVRTLSGQNKLEVSLIENLQRKDLNVMEVATAYMKLRNQFNMNLEQISKSTGNRSVSTISNTIRLLRLPSSVREALAEGLLTEGQARPLIDLDIEIIDQFLPRILSENWPARKIEQFVVDIKINRTNSNIPKKNHAITRPYAKRLKRIQNYLNAEVRLKVNTKGAGNLVIRFKDEDDFERIKNLLS
jgi:ParB family chromosome partitioning protein